MRSPTLQAAPPSWFELDGAGFPLIWIAELAAYVHWLPVTKVQFEVFLCDTEDASFDAAWYREVLSLNPRLTGSALDRDNYWRCLLTGVLTGEARRFAAWCGEGFFLPTWDQWQVAYRAAALRPPLSAEEISLIAAGSERTRVLAERLESVTTGAARDAGRQRTLADQMLLRQGALEWAEATAGSGQWVAAGEPPAGFRRIVASPELPVYPPQAASVRCELFGFRLMRRPAAEET